MSFRSAAAKAGWLAFLVVSVPVVGCGSDNNGGGDGGGTQENTDAATVFHRDAASATPSEAGGEASISTQYDGTVGLPCASDLDCQPAGGPGLAVCSSSLMDPVYPTPVCVITSCDAGSDNNVHYCDGPDNPASPGICVAVSGGGLCLPNCQFANDGSPALGCTGNDACTFYGAGVTASNQVIGVGYCWGACTTNSQCPTGSACQVDQGVCLTTTSTPTKSVGQACTAADNNAGGACSCLINPSNTSASAPGLCTQSCQVGLTKDACPSGFACQAFEPTSLTATTPGFATQNTGLLGLCVAMCSGGDAGGGSPGIEADASSEEGGTSDASTSSGTDASGGACPAPTTCDTTTAAGATCLP